MCYTQVVNKLSLLTHLLLPNKIIERVSYLLQSDELSCFLNAHSFKLGHGNQNCSELDFHIETNSSKYILATPGEILGKKVKKLVVRYLSNIPLLIQYQLVKGLQNSSGQIIRPHILNMLTFLYVPLEKNMIIKSLVGSFYCRSDYYKKKSYLLNVNFYQST
ncbi:hypothetical protein CROQUDRAFT_578871 [Cronartium quercuum f. sp. fusiforme G11]|uniref:Uncharacterized protein n=1 Tax=Cronartium quercuum f. sp. fusiforme G11 TaxID=708437 RepID=A0A9P6NG45_9BASI|nr:hypothetical protein CROQUDRAFT_578871 [Cronartium quercuum f. sp. fusiforme G11]